MVVRNPTSRKELGLTTAYTFNNLNQFTSGSWTGKLIVIGEVNYAAGTVTVSGVTGRIFPDRVFEATNITVSAGTNVLTAIYHGPAFTNTQMVATNTSSVVVVTPTFGYDAKGNLTNDAEFVYQYDIANRLTNVISKASGSSVLAARYDGLGRRVEVMRDGSTVERYVYFPGSFLVLAVLDGANAVKEIYTHGPDLSGVVGGAGGIGGILSVSTNISQTTASKYCHADAMGNVVLVTDPDGKQLAAYGFAPFGKLLNQIGDFRARFLFSSKESDPETGFVNFGYRVFGTSAGRWLTRDPIHEVGGMNLYGYVRNNAVNTADAMGLQCAGFINGQACNPFTGQPLPQNPDMGGWPGAVQDFCSWVGGADDKTYGPGTQESEQMRQSSIGRKLREEFLRRNAGKPCKKWRNLGQIGLDFGVREFVRDLPNGTAHFVGSADGSVSIGAVNEDRCFLVAKYKIVNRTSLRSFLYHLWPEGWNNTTPGTPACNWWQTYEWNETHTCSKPSGDE